MDIKSKTILCTERLRKYIEQKLNPQKGSAGGTAQRVDPTESMHAKIFEYSEE